MIQPVRVAEIRRAIRADESVQGVGRELKPGWVGQVAASLHDDDQVAAADDGETKLACVHAKGGVTGQRLRIPQHRWTPLPRIGPARFPWQVIAGDVRSAVEHIQIRSWRVAFEIQSCQSSAVFERVDSDTRDAPGNGNISQANT